MLLLLSFLLLINSCAAGVDIVAKSVERLRNGNTSACDNFYRHSCPWGSNNLIKEYIIPEIIEKVKKQNELNRYDFIDDFTKFKIAGDSKVLYDKTEPLPNYKLQHLVELYEKRCATQHTLEPLLKYFEKFLEKNLTKDDFIDCKKGPSLLLEKFEEKAQALKIELSEEKRSREGYYDLTEMVKKTQEDLQDRRLQLTGARMMGGDKTISKGIDIVATMIEDMKEIAVDWLEDTEWVKKNDAVERLQETTRNILMVKNFDSIINETQGMFARFDDFYKTCKTEIEPADDLGNILCLMVAVDKKEFKPYDKDDDILPIVVDHNAANMRTSRDSGVNWNASLNIGFDLLIAAVEVEDAAAMIGFVGATVGHEIGHSLEKHEKAIPFFSNISSKCVSKLFEDTCKVFKEHSCEYHINQQGETVSDVFGNQLSYQIFKNHYGDRVEKMHPTLNITYEQLFFYGTAIEYCQPYESRQVYYTNKTPEDHPAKNIRVNAIAQIPSFETAFNCSSTSRMAKIIEEECVIYGPNAPATRRHKK